MKLLFQQRPFSWFDSYDIYDENGNAIYRVKGQLSWGHCLYIYNMQEEHIATLKEKLLVFLSTFEIFIDGTSVGSIEKQFAFFKPVFYFPYKEWMIEGNFFEWDYEIKDSEQKVIGTINKQLFQFTDTYQIEVFNDEDALYALMIVLAIDAQKCSRN